MSKASVGGDPFPGEDSGPSVQLPPVLLGEEKPPSVSGDLRIAPASTAA